MRKNIPSTDLRKWLRIRAFIVTPFMLGVSMVPANAQWTTGTGGAIYYNGGNVGIGTPTPAGTLDVNGYIHAWRNVNPNTSASGAYIGWNALNGGTGETDFINNQGWGIGGFAFFNTPVSGSPRSLLMFINGNGNVGIGTQVPQHLLQVAGTIGAEEVIVSSTGADYVFDPKYRIAPLTEVASYIRAAGKLDQ